MIDALGNAPMPIGDYLVMGFGVILILAVIVGAIGGTTSGMISNAKKEQNAAGFEPTPIKTTVLVGSQWVATLLGIGGLIIGIVFAGLFIFAASSAFIFLAGGVGVLAVLFVIGKAVIG